MGVSVTSFCPHDDVSTTFTDHSSDSSNSSNSFSNVLQCFGVNFFMEEEEQDHACLSHVPMTHVTDFISSSVEQKEAFPITEQWLIDAMSGHLSTELKLLRLLSPHAVPLLLHKTNFQVGCQCFNKILLLLWALVLLRTKHSRQADQNDSFHSRPQQLWRENNSKLAAGQQTSGNSAVQKSQANFDWFWQTEIVIFFINELCIPALSSLTEQQIDASKSEILSQMSELLTSGNYRPLSTHTSTHTHIAQHKCSARSSTHNFSFVLTLCLDLRNCLSTHGSVLCVRPQWICGHHFSKSHNFWHRPRVDQNQPNMSFNSVSPIRCTSHRTHH